VGVGHENGEARGRDLFRLRLGARNNASNAKPQAERDIASRLTTMELLMLSIVIPSYQRTDLLATCLRSVTRHAPAGTEVTVVDDASVDGRVSQVAASFWGVRGVRLPRRSGFCVAANTGIRASTGDIIELLNDDTEVQAGWADAALACFADPDTAAVAPLVLTGPDGTVVDSAGDRYYLGGVAGKRGHGEKLTPELLRARSVFGASAS